MQWLFAIGGLILAGIFDENPLPWMGIGFICGYLLHHSSEIKRLQTQLEELQREFENLKQNKTPPEIVSNIETVTLSKPPASTSFSNTFETPPPTAESAAKPLPPLIFEQPKPRKKLIVEAQPSDSWTPPPPRQPTDIDKFFTLIWSWFTDGNTFVRVGIVILFIGMSFLLNLAMEHGFIPIGLRLSAVAAVGVGLLIVGWRLQDKRLVYALLIQGGGVGLLYLTIFASFSRYQLLPAGLAFTLLIAIVALAAMLAVLQDALSLALFGAIGGFLAPVLTSTGSNNYIGLFSFYAVLNAGIFAIAWFKAWRILNLVGFGFTFSIGAFWGMSRYQAAYFATTEPFLILFFLFYVGIGILYATKRAPNFKDIIDGTLIFGTPILAFGLQAGMVNVYEYGVAISAFTLGGFYLALTYWVWHYLGSGLKFLSETFLAVAVIFITLAIPFAVDGAATSATWAVEGTGVLWVSVRQQHFVRRVFALLLQFASGFALVADIERTQVLPFANSLFIGIALISLCLGLSSWLLAKPFESRRAIEKLISPLWLASGLIWLFAGFEGQISYHGLGQFRVDLTLSLSLCLIALLSYLAVRLAWLTAHYATLAMLFPLLVSVLMLADAQGHPSIGFGLLLWPLAFGLYFLGLKRAAAVNETGKLWLYFISGAFVCGLLFWEGFWQLLLGASLLALLFNELAKRFSWPQMRLLGLGLLAVLYCLSFVQLLTPNQHPFYLPDTYSAVEWPFEAGLILWPLAFVVLYWLLYDCDKQQAPIKSLPWVHALSLWLLVLLPTWEASWHIDLPVLNGWHTALFALTSIAALWLITLAPCYPFKQRHADYINLAAPPLRWFLMAWSLLALRSAAESAPLPWLPLFNPLDLVQAITLLTLLGFTFYLSGQYITLQSKRSFYKALAWFGFVWLNFVLLRTLHHWAGLVWHPEILNSALTQTCLSIFWTLSGLSLAIVATRKQLRSLWLTGAAMLVVVVLKLFILDLDSHGSIERIISFITVGGLLMLIGYFAPLPPKAAPSNESSL